ncbi:MAG TPA: hypothetical protein VM755_19785 [Stellaceae bacterium]|nr:hypothetical protein [Stellaceae bacterium]
MTRPMHTFNLAIGDEVFRSLLAPEDTAERLVTFARRRQLRNHGRLPTWYGSRD